jgi:hypothetical protein
MCMELYHGDEDYIELEDRETYELIFRSKQDDYKYGSPILSKTDNDPIWVS